MMPTSGIVPIPCADAAEGMVQLPANSKHPSKLSVALARRAARRKVLEHVSLGHGSRVVQRKSPPLVMAVHWKNLGVTCRCQIKANSKRGRV